jgi:hypothetical protein
MDRAAVVTESWDAVGCREQRTIEVDDRGLLRDEQRRRDRQR